MSWMKKSMKIWVAWITLHRACPLVKWKICHGHGFTNLMLDNNHKFYTFYSIWPVHLFFVRQLKELANLKGFCNMEWELCKYLKSVSSHTLLGCLDAADIRNLIGVTPPISIDRKTWTMAIRYFKWRHHP